jgi:hypothetical protein
MGKTTKTAMEVLYSVVNPLSSTGSVTLQWLIRTVAHLPMGILERKVDLDLRACKISCTFAVIYFMDLRDGDFVYIIRKYRGQLLTDSSAVEHVTATPLKV